MPITVKHSGNAAPALVGAYAGGEGERGAKDAPVLSSLFGQRAQAEAARVSQGFSQLQQHADRRLERGIARADQRFAEQQARIDRADALARDDALRAQSRDQFLADRAHAEARQDLLSERAASAAEEERRAALGPDLYGQQDGLFPELTREMYEANKPAVDNAISQWRLAGSDDTLTDDERAAVRADIRSRLLDTLAGPRAPAPATLAERWDKETLEIDGARYGVDKNGKWYQIPAALPAAGGPGAESPDLPVAPEIGALGIPRAEYSRLWSQFQKALAYTDDDGRVHTPSAAEIHGSIEAMLKQGGYGMPEPAPASPPPTSSAPTSPIPDGSPDPAFYSPELRQQADFWKWRSEHPYSGQPYTSEAARAHAIDIGAGDAPPDSMPPDSLADAWDRELAAEQGQPPPAPPATPSPTNPAPTSPPAPDPSRWPSGAPRLDNPALGIRDTGGSLVIDGVEYPLHATDPRRIPVLRPKR